MKQPTRSLQKFPLPKVGGYTLLISIFHFFIQPMSSKLGSGKF
ncbi:MAG: hypothetical protein [Olavius algarvensis Gamma 1 endosymbiont]|nr:MAG: hypothetical protein [Olavius algarvensis Gamma 1 endosymbiont]